MSRILDSFQLHVTPVARRRHVPARPLSGYLNAMHSYPLVTCTSPAAAPPMMFVASLLLLLLSLRSEARELRTNMSSSSAGSDAELTLSTCTWNQLDVDGQCVLQPRSCFSCLETATSSGEDCTLTPQGVCMGMEAYDPKQDYRRPGLASAYPPQLNYFPSTNTSYCKPTEKACELCRTTTFKSWATNPSRHCKGEDGCVCVSICESNQWERAIQSTLSEILAADQQSNQSLLNCSIEEVPPDEVAPSSTEGITTDFVGLPATRGVLSSDDECMWYQNQTYCGAPRTCFDCLNTGLYSGNKCMLHSSGYCTSIAAYTRSKDWRRANRSDAGISLFPSTNTTYCQADDAACANCRATNFTQWQNVSSPPVFCTGGNGCVCVASCESASWSSAVVRLTCDVDKINTLTPTPLGRISSVAIVSSTFLGCMILSFAVLVVFNGYRRYATRRGVHRHPRRREPTGPTLELSGWKAMREKLITTEREFVGEADDGTTVAAIGAPHRRRLRSTSEDDAPALVFEEGDAYRPLSPSRMHE